MIKVEKYLDTYKNLFKIKQMTLSLKTSKNFVETFVNSLFDIKSKEEFDKMAVSAFQYQYQYNGVYSAFVKLMHIDITKIDAIEKIPFLPICFFRSHQIISGNSLDSLIFQSSGTSGSIKSKHFVSDINLYQKSFRKGFEHFYGKVDEYCIMALLPSYLERGGSSLVFMVDDLIKNSRNPNSGFFLNNTYELIEKLKLLHHRNEKILLMGVSYALLDIIENFNISIPHAIIMETGGMKGKRKELIKQELHQKLCDGFNVKQIHSEYGMTELLSQAYSFSNGIFKTPSWMKVLTRDLYAPSYMLEKNKTGGINIIDLANINSCCFIETQDLGKVYDDDSFEIMGRMDNSDIRGCNLLIA